MKMLILPSTFITLSAIAGLALSCARSTRKVGLSLAALAVTLYTIFGSGPISFLLLGHLEFGIRPATDQERAGVRTIVVLAGHAEPDGDIPLSSRLNSASAFRVLEALRLFRLAPEDATVIVSGTGPVPQILRDMLTASGIPADRVQIDESPSTLESARHLSRVLGGAPFLLVTSAGHMPRAIRVFQKAGTDPHPAPTHYLTRRNWLAVRFLPSPIHLAYSDLAVSEYTALFWYRLNGWV